jgi:hypothetical protein
MGDLPGRLPGLYERRHGVTASHAEHSAAPPKETGPVLWERRYQETIRRSLRQNLENTQRVVIIHVLVHEGEPVHVLPHERLSPQCA